MQFGGFGRGLLLRTSNAMKSDLFAHPAILHFHALPNLNLGIGLSSFPLLGDIGVARTRTLGTWPRGVTVSTLDSESSDRGSNPREAFQVGCL